MITFLLHIRSANGTVTTLSFPTAFDRGLILIGLVSQPVDLRVEDVAATAAVAQAAA